MGGMAKILFLNSLEAMSMLHWAHLHFPHLRYLIRADDDVYLRPGPLLQQLEKRPPVGRASKGSWDIVAYGWSTSKVNGPHSCSLVAWKGAIVGLDSTKNSARRPCCSWSFQKCGEEQTALQRWNHSPCSVTENLIRDRIRTTWRISTFAFANLLVMKWAFTAVHWGLALDHVAFFRISLGQLRQRFYGGAGSISSSLQFWRAAAIEAETASQQRFNELIQFLGGWPFSSFFFFFSLGKLDSHTHNVEWQNFHHIPHRYNIFTCVILIHYAYTAYMHTVTVHF